MNALGSSQIPARYLAKAWRYPFLFCSHLNEAKEVQAFWLLKSGGRRKTMKKNHARSVLAIAIITLAFGSLAIVSGPHEEEQQSIAARPVLTVTLTTAQMIVMPVKVTANGNIMAWQEASIGTEANGLRLADVSVNVGDTVQRGQVVATFASDTVTSELAQSRAATAEAIAMFAEAIANANRARELTESGAMSAQQIQQSLTTERTAKARLEAARAAEKNQRLRLAQTEVLAPDDGVISARSATVGAVIPAGQELFRMIRGNRLEWRAEVASADLARLESGQTARVIPVDGEPISGKLRMIAPVVDIQTRNAMAYVDLPQPGPARAGMFARGEFHIGSERMLALPQSAVLLRDGFNHVFLLDAQSRVVQTRVTVGRRTGHLVEILTGLDASARVVAAGGAFLGEGDLVRVVSDISTPPLILLPFSLNDPVPAMSFNVSSWSIRNPTPSVLLFILLTVLGLIGFGAMKVQNFPDIDLPTVTIAASLPGASPAQLENDVARKIENSLATIQGVKHIKSTLTDGEAAITVEFNLEKSTQDAVDDVRDAVSRVRADLPSDLRDPVIRKVELADAPIMTYTVASTRMDNEALSWFVDNEVSRIMLSVPGVGQITRVGGATREVRVDLKSGRLLAMNARFCTK
ncbi:efflux RND transporter periplasmic adaptor subunit, partial [Pseudomonas syringae group genomosp. 3]|uniref:efflux RND transporter periplasmic adaptor subunit n=1 Tax=Pseudomonas syringae group genomosp. 3 TaxID=251701 RepID=UPI0011C402D2